MPFIDFSTPFDCIIDEDGIYNSNSIPPECPLIEDGSCILGGYQCGDGTYGCDACGECMESEVNPDACLSLYNGLLPDEFSIKNIYPNPFNPRTNIVYTVPENAYVKIAVYDLRGIKLAVLKNDYQTAGYYTITWDASSFSSGIYFIEMQSHDFREVRKILQIK